MSPYALPENVTFYYAMTQCLKLKNFAKSLLSQHLFRYFSILISHKRLLRPL